jgi:hypothetical protein
MRFPNLFIVGAPKAGTTTVAATLAMSPDVYLPSRKEPHYYSGVGSGTFGSEFIPAITDRDRYLALYREAGSTRYILDASTSYLWCKDAATRICRDVPDARAIILLREPVSRSHSHYLNNVREGFERRPLATALREEQSALGGAPWHLAYLANSLYPGMVERYMAVFGGRVTVLFFEDLVGAPEAFVPSLFAPLSLLPQPALRYENPYTLPRNRALSALFQNDWVRYTSRKLLPDAARRYGRSKILAPAAKPTVDREALHILRDRTAGVADTLEALLGRKPPWSTSGLA